MLRYLEGLVRLCPTFAQELVALDRHSAVSADAHAAGPVKLSHPLEEEDREKGLEVCLDTPREVRVRPAQVVEDAHHPPPCPPF